jgi:hypothetical protein
MSQLPLWISSAMVLLGIFRLGVDRESPLRRTLLRPAVLGLLSAVLLLVAAGGAVRWPYLLVALTALVGIWEGYAGAYGSLRGSRTRRSAARQVQVCATWLAGVLLNLSVLNISFQQLHPGTFQWRGEPASLLDVAYLTLLTFTSSGYGDVLPGTATGKLLAMLTSGAGLVYATILCTALLGSLRED